MTSGLYRQFPISRAESKFPKSGTEANLLMMADAKYADVKITNSKHTREWAVHRAIVCGRCPFFDMCLKNSFKESHAQTIDLPEDDPVHIEYLLKYLYTIDLSVAASCLTPVKEPKQDPRRAPPTFGEPREADVYSDVDAFALFALADRLGLVDLKLHWETVLMTKAMNLDVNVKVETNQAVREEKTKQLLSFVESAYNCENSGVENIRRALIKTLERMKARAPSGAFYAANSMSQQKEVLGEMIKARPQLGIDLVESLSVVKNNQPVTGLLKYNAMQEMLQTDPEILLKLIDSLAMSS